jgi:hypothetical protein
VSDRRRNLLFGKTRKNTKRETSLQSVCSQSEVLEFFTSDDPLGTAMFTLSMVKLN